MGKNKSCDSKTRHLIVEFYKDKMSYSKIAERLGCSKTMVFNAVQHFKTKNTAQDTFRKPRPRITTKRQDQIIVRESKKFPHKSAREIKLAVFPENEPGPSIDTIKRRLREAGLFGRVCRKKPLLSEKNRKKRLEFAKKYRDWTVEQWKKVLFSDETKVNRIWSDGRTFVRRPKSKEFDPKYTRMTVKHGGGNLMVWGAMSWSGTGPIQKIEGRMDKFQYTSILENKLVPYADDNLPVTWIFQQDNDPKHTAKHTIQWFKDNHITVLDWPSCSPDLNPIENLWKTLKTKVGQYKIKNFVELHSKIQELWTAIPHSVCKELVESMPRRCKAVIDAKGFATKY